MTYRRTDRYTDIMRCSKRKHMHKYASLAAITRISTATVIICLNMIGCSGLQPTSSNLARLWGLCIQLMIPHAWYRILSLDSFEYNGIIFTVGHTWDYQLGVSTQD